jgi:hypothetical protein
MGAGRALADTEEGWRFVQEEDARVGARWPWRLDPIQASVTENGVVDWSVTELETGRWIFGRRPGGEFGRAMTEAQNALLRTLTSRLVPLGLSFTG